MEAVLRDLRLAIRALRRTPAFTVVAIVTLALGVGANATVFSVLDAMLLRPLRIVDPDRVFFIEMTGGQFTHSIPDYRDLRSRNSTFADLAAYRITSMALQNGRGAERVWGYLATANYFELLGVRPVLGRFYTPAEDAAPGAAPFAVLSYDSWQRRFGGNPRVIGTAVRINDLPYTVLGVMPRGFYGTEVFYRPDVWLPMSMQSRVESDNWLDDRHSYNSFLIGRTKPTVSSTQATADLDRIGRGLATEQGAPTPSTGYRLVRPGLLGNLGRAPIAAFLAGLMTLAGLVLLAASANLGSLLASRMLDRYREIAIRLAIGASRGTVIRATVIEILVLAAAGGAAGTLVAEFILVALSAWQLPLGLPAQFDVTPTAGVIAFSALVTLAAGLLSAFVPARHAWHTDPVRLVGTPVVSRLSGWQLRDVLLATQVALCCVLVLASVVSIRNLRAALTASIGFSVTNVSVAGFDLSAAGYSPREGARFKQRALDAARALPGVSDAAFTSRLPLTVERSSAQVFPSDVAPADPRGFDALVYEVSPGLLPLLRVPFAAGRDIAVTDDLTREHVAIVNRTFARRVLRTEDAIQMRFRTGAGRLVRVVGLVEDGKYESLSESPKPVMFRPAAQSYSSSTVLLVRSSLPPAVASRELERIVSTLDPRVPLLVRGGLDEIVAGVFLPARAAGVVMTSFGVLALMLAIVGVYGLAAYSVRSRHREIGIRMAIGARPREALTFVLGRTAAVLGIGSAAGIAAGIAGAPLLQQITYHASARDPFIVVAVAAVMASIGLAAAWVPARRAVALDPADALRDA